MKKYNIYKNRRTRNHPSIEISNNGKRWRNLEITSSPVKGRSYIELKVYISPSIKKKGYVRKYIRDDPIRTRGELLKKYNLSDEDMKEIENYIVSQINKKR